MTQRVTVVPADRIGTINPNLYGHFSEHLGTCIYEGIWVGEDSAIPNQAGIRLDVVNALRRIHPPVLRWPGGNFADDYHWQDGIGPRDRRPTRLNLWWDAVEPNQFGTHEFITFCRMIGAQPYLCGNVGSGSPRELREWVEYCNYGGDTTLTRTRAANGSPEPFGVRYWGVGNENWAAGGSFEGGDYAVEYKRFATFLQDIGKVPLTLIACGAYGSDTSWTRSFFEKYTRTPFPGVPRLHGFGVHYYCGTAGNAIEYTTDQWYQLLAAGAEIEKVVTIQRAAMDAYDPQRKIGLIIDEWGAWHPTDEAHHRAHLWQQNTMRDALIAAQTLDTFNRHADKVVMSNIAQMINVLQSMILTDGPRMLTTPTYHVYDLYQAHQGGQALRLVCEGDMISYCNKQGEDAELAQLSGSASLKGDMLTISLVNASAEAGCTVALNCVGGELIVEGAQVLASGDIHAYNSFDAPDAVKPRALAVTPVGDAIELELPAASVARIQAKLA